MATVQGNGEMGLATRGTAQLANQERLVALYAEKREALERLKSKARAPRTLECYANDFAQLEAFGEEAGIHIPPMTNGEVDLHDPSHDDEHKTCGIPAATILLWLEASQHLKPPTIARRMAAVKWFHGRNRLQSPTDHPEVSDVLAGFNREYKTKEMKANTISPEQLVAMVSSLGDDLRGRRDKAVLLLGFFGAFRRSELVALDVADLEDHEKGLAVFIRQSKTDQTGKGAVKVIPFTSSELTCPVRATKAWLKAAEIESGPVFRGVNGHVHDERLSARTVTRIVKAAAERIGLKPAGYSSHSLRRSHVTIARHKADVSHASVRLLTFHKSDQQVDSYTDIPPPEVWTEASSAQLATYFDRVTNPTPLDDHDAKAAATMATAERVG